MAKAAKLDVDDIHVLLEDNNVRSAMGIAETEVRYPASTSSVAVLNKHMRELEVRYHRTRLHLERATQKTEGVQKEIRKLRADKLQLEKDLHKKSALLERVAADKKVAEAQAIANRDYAKRIEQTVAMGTRGHTAAAKHAELLARIRELEGKNEAQRDTIAEKDAATQDALAKITILKRSLEIRIRDVGLDGSVHNGLIYEVARLQETNAGLSMQVAAEANHVAELQTAIEAKDLELQAAEAVHVASERARAECEARVAQRMEELHIVQTTCDNMADEKRMLLGYVQEQAEKLLQAEAAVQKLQASHKQAIDGLQVQLQAQAERIETTNATASAGQAAYDKLLQAYQITQDALVHERSGGEALRGLVQEKAATIEQLRHELHDARDGQQAWQGRARDLEHDCATLTSDAVSLKDTIRLLQHRVGELEASVAEQARVADTLKATMAQAAADVDAITKERNEAARSMNEAVTISAAAMEEQQAMATTIAAQKHQLEQLKQSKQLLQNAMLEQLAAVRKQLQMERIARLTAESRRGDVVVSTVQSAKEGPLPTNVRHSPDTIQPRDMASHVPLPTAPPSMASFVSLSSSVGAPNDALTLLDLAGSIGSAGPTLHN